MMHPQIENETPTSIVKRQDERQFELVFWLTVFSQGVKSIVCLLVMSTFCLMVVTGVKVEEPFSGVVYTVLGLIAGKAIGDYNNGNGKK
jgi:hypothetical protein